MTQPNLFNTVKNQMTFGNNLFNQYQQANQQQNTGTNTGGTGTLDLSGMFGLYPFSVSNQQSSGSSRSQSGVNWNTPFMKSITPSLISSAQGLKGLAESIGGTLNDQYSNLMRRSLQPEMFQGTLNSLANRGILNSSMGSEAMASSQKGIAKAIADKAFEALLAQKQQEMEVPKILADIAALGQESKSSGSTSSSGSSYSANPLAPWELYLNSEII